MWIRLKSEPSWRLLLWFLFWPLDWFKKIKPQHPIFIGFFVVIFSTPSFPPPRCAGTCMTTWGWRLNTTSMRTSGSWGMPHLIWSWKSNRRFPSTTSRWKNSAPQHLSVSFPTPLSLLHLKLCLVFSSWGPSLAMTKPRRVTPLSRLRGCQVWTELKEIHEPWVFITPSPRVSACLFRVSLYVHNKI